jgi:hypothetical protein
MNLKNLIKRLPNNGELLVISKKNLRNKPKNDSGPDGYGWF